LTSAAPNGAAAQTDTPAKNGLRLAAEV